MSPLQKKENNSLLGMTLLFFSTKLFFRNNHRLSAVTATTLTQTQWTLLFETRQFQSEKVPVVKWSLILY